MITVHVDRTQHAFSMSKCNFLNCVGKNLKLTNLNIVKNQITMECSLGKQTIDWND